jgi:hypothetical protein
MKLIADDFLSNEVKQPSCDTLWQMTDERFILSFKTPDDDSSLEANRSSLFDLVVIE